MLAAFEAVRDYASPEICRQVARSFPGVPHRLEEVRNLNGVTYINDSIASSPTRTIAGLHALKKKPIVIAGGYDKHLDYTPLGREITAHVKALVLTGATSEKIKQAVLGTPEYDADRLPIYDDLDFAGAVNKAYEIARPGDIVIMSPASASFDQFKNFMVRGNTFKDLVRKLPGEK
jgi:UDP-N-acetylmuramoylalanine--D-glutamate ligase